MHVGRVPVGEAGGGEVPAAVLEAVAASCKTEATQSTPLVRRLQGDVPLVRGESLKGDSIGQGRLEGDTPLVSGDSRQHEFICITIYVLAQIYYLQDT